MRATFLGVSTVLLDDGQTAIMTDGFFSRPGLLRSLRPIAPDDAVIDACLRRAGVSSLAAVLVSHSHYDHALDSPAVASRTGADLVGSSSTQLIAHGSGFPVSRFRVASFGEPLAYGAFVVTPIRAAHTPKPRFTGQITHAVRPPASIRAYKMGECYSWHIAHPDGSLIIHASTNFVPGAYDGLPGGRHRDLDAVGGAARAQEPQRRIQVVGHPRQRHQRPVKRLEEVVPMDRHNATRPDVADHLMPVLGLERVGQPAERGDPEVHGLSRQP